MLWKENYTPFGDRAVKAVNATGNRQWYTGKPVDSETGLSNFGARMYDPAIGRFMGVDAVGFGEGNLHSFNRYAYANNNPYKFVDRDGNASSLALCLGGPPGCAAGVGLAVLAVGYSILPAEDQQRINQAVGAGFRSAVDSLRGSADGYLISVGPGPVISNSDGGDKSNSVPTLPSVLVGGQGNEQAGPNKGGARHTSGPLKPEFGGTGNFGADLEKLTGGTRPAQPGDKAPPGSLVGANGIFGRPENKSGGSSIDIPGNGSKPHETLHY